MMNKIKENNAQPRTTASVLAKNTKAIINFVLILTIICLFLPICALSYTKSTPKPQILSAYAQNSHGVTTNEFMPDDFTAFVGTTINYDIYSQYPIVCENFDGLALTITTVATDSYIVSISSSAPIASQLIIKNEFGGVAFANFSFVAYEISSIELISAGSKFNAMGDNYLQVRYNGNSQLLSNDSTIDAAVKTNSNDVATIDASAIIKSNNARHIVLNFENVDYTQYVGTKFYVSKNGIESNVELQIDNLPLTTTFTLQKPTIDYFANSESINVNVMIDANSFTTFALFDTMFAKIEDISKTDTSENFDIYTISIIFTNLNAPSELIICARTASGTIERALQLNAVSTISKIFITADKTSLKPNEKVNFTAILNDDPSLSYEIDWYVNDQKIETATQFEYARKQGGSFTVSAKVGDITSNSIIVNVSYNNSELVIWYIVFAIALVILIALIIFKKKKKTFISSMSLTDRARKFVPRYKTYINKYTRHQFFDLVYDIANLRDDILFNFDETKDLCFEKASRELADAHKIVRTIYKAPKEEKKTLLENNLSAFETIMNSVIDDLNDYAQNHPDQAIFKLKKKNK